MSNGARNTSLDNLVHIANMSHELQVLNKSLKQEEDKNLKMDESSTPNKLGKVKRMACVECRQQKSRCDAHEKHPAPCSRCAKKGLKCDLKSDYKRTYKRARIAQIEKEFSELKRSLTSAQAAELLNKAPTLINNQVGISVPSNTAEITSKAYNYYENSPISGNRSSNSQTPVQHGINTGTQYGVNSWNTTFTDFQHPSPESNILANEPTVFKEFNQNNYMTLVSEPFSKTHLPEYVLECSEKSIEDIVLSSDTIRTLYLEFVDCYHPILPVVDVQKGPERIYKLCPALFWVIIFISLRRYKDEFQKSLLLQLSPLIKDILSEITISPITRYNPTEEDEPILNACSVYSVQAFLLYSFWPPITSSLSADSSWNTIGLALFQAIRIGLHSPNIQNSDSSKTIQQLDMIQEQAKTWIACNIVSQTIASSLGFPAFVQFDSSVWRSLQPGSSISIPPSIQFMMEVSHFEDQISKTLISNPMDPNGLVEAAERLSLLKVLLKQLNGLEMKLVHEAPVDDGFRKFQLLIARVRLLTYFFMDTTRIPPFELQKGLVKLYNAAIAMINHAQLCQAKDKRFIKYLPGVDILNIWQSSCIIAKIVHSPLKSVIDIGAGKQSYIGAISLAAKASILKHDLPYRASGIMKNMWQLFRTLDEKNATTLGIKVKTRMCASIFFDCLNLLREQVGMIKLNSKTDQNVDNEGDDNEVISYDEDEEIYDENEEAIDDLDDKQEDISQRGSNSQKSTPGSNTSSRTRRQRSLSNTMDAESKARKIIRTIPLDPRPISAGSKRSSIFKVVNTSSDSSPHVKSDKGTPESQQKNTPDQSSIMVNSGFLLSRNTPTNPIPVVQSPRQHVQFQQPYDYTQKMHQPTYSVQQMHSHPNQVPSTNARNSFENKRNMSSQMSRTGNMEFSKEVFNNSPEQRGLENKNMDGLDIDTFDVNSDLLWKDVDSVMNDFGFHT